MLRTYREILKERLESRIKANPQYSLRAFAKSLDLAAPRLSCILNNKQGISKKVANAIADKLALSPEEKELFVMSAMASDARSKQKRLAAQEKIVELSSKSKFKSLDEDKFKIICDWYYFAILELTDLSHFKSDTAWIAKRLGLNKMQTEQAIERLLRVGLLEVIDNKYKQKSASLSTESSVPSDTMRDFYRQILDKTKIKLEQNNPQEFNFSTLTIGIEKSKLKEFKEKIVKFQDEINAFAETIPKSKRDEVYLLNINFVKLTEDL